MAQRICGFDPLVGVERQAVFQEVDEVVQLSSFRVVHAPGCGHETGPEIASWFDHWESPDGCL